MGVVLIVQIVDVEGEIIDISAATDLTIKLGMPDGTAKNFTAVLYINGSDGKMSYTTLPSDINQVGTYKIQGKLNISSGPKSSFVGTFNVLENVA